eukprot:COSAG04_NODE_20723_length_388_cov_0.484429_1_plen_28_part_10
MTECVAVVWQGRGGGGRTGVGGVDAAGR